MYKIVKPLPISILADKSLKYNPSLSYEEGDNIYAESKNWVIDSYTNNIDYLKYLVRKLALDFDNIELSYQKVDIMHNNLSEWCSKTEYLPVKLAFEDLQQFKNIKIVETEEISEEGLTFALSYQECGLAYFGNHDTLEIPSVIYHYLKERKQLDVTFTLFNMNLCKSIPPCLKECKKDFDIPELKLEYLPKKAIWSKIKKDYYTIIPPAEKEGYFEHYVLYTNLPKELYKNIIIENKILHYNITNKCFYGHVDLNQTNLNFCCKDLAENLPKEIIVLKLTNDGHFVCRLSYKQLLSSLYIGYPSIPVCILVDPFSLYDHSIYKKKDIDIEKTKEFLKPYFLLNND